MIFVIDEGHKSGALPANPAYWTQTRVAITANSYSNYRPISLWFEYVPTVGFNTNGSITMGTIYATSLPTQNPQIVLQASNGGVTSQVYSRTVSRISLASCLSQNNYRTAGTLNDDDLNPFYFAWTIQSNAEVGVFGNLYVHYVFDFYNPTVNQGVVQSQEMTLAQAYADNRVLQDSCVVMQEPVVEEPDESNGFVDTVLKIGQVVLEIFVAGVKTWVRNQVTIAQGDSPSLVQSNDDAKVIKYWRGDSVQEAPLVDDFKFEPGSFVKIEAGVPSGTNAHRLQFYSDGILYTNNNGGNVVSTKFENNIGYYTSMRTTDSNTYMEGVDVLLRSVKFTLLKPMDQLTYQLWLDKQWPGRELIPMPNSESLVPETKLTDYVLIQKVSDGEPHLTFDKVTGALRSVTVTNGNSSDFLCNPDGSFVASALLGVTSAGAGTIMLLREWREQIIANTEAMESQ